MSERRVMRIVSLLLTMVIVMNGMLFAGGSSEVKQAEKEESIVLRVVDWSDSSAKMREEFNRKFEENHPGVTVEYTCLTVDQFKNTIVTMIKSGNGPDLFPIPAPLTLSVAVSEDWYQPLDPFVTEEFKASINPAAFVPGVTLFDGSLYVLPENAPTIHSVIYYNKAVLKEAGVTKLPETYSEFLEVCKQVTESSKGASYGLIEGGTQLNRLSILARTLASEAGGKIAQEGKILTVDGRASYDSDGMVKALSFLQSLVDEGVLHPDTVSINAPTARELFAQNQAAFLMQGMWCIPAWASTYPELEVGVIGAPHPDGQTEVYGTQGESYAPWMGIYKDSKHPEIAAKYLMALYSEEYGYQTAQVRSGNSISIIPSINENNMVNPSMLEYYTVSNEVTRQIPLATVFDEKAYDFYKEVKDVNPSLGVIVQGVLASSIKDGEIKKRLETLSENSTIEWKRAAEASGFDYAHLEFPNWDLTKDYTAKDYEALKK